MLKHYKSRILSKFRSKYSQSHKEIEDIDMVAIYEKATGKSIKGSSKRMTGLCPFNDHQDTTPSFSLYPETQSFYCFGCRRSGSASWFRHEMERIYGI